MDKYRAWRVRLNKDSLKRWERKRAQGKARFLIRGVLTWTAGMLLVSALPEYYLHRDVRLFLLSLILIPTIGVIGAFALWWTNEGKYRAAKIDARMKSIEMNTVPPDEA